MREKNHFSLICTWYATNGARVFRVLLYHIVLAIYIWSRSRYVYDRSHEATMFENRNARDRLCIGQTHSAWVHCETEVFNVNILLFWRNLSHYRHVYILYVYIKYHRPISIRMHTTISIILASIHAYKLQRLEVYVPAFSDRYLAAKTIIALRVRTSLVIS